MIYGAPTKVVYEGVGKTCDILSTMGVTQGDPLAALLYSTVLRSAVEATLARHKKVIIVGIADDRHILGEIDDVLAALTTYKSELAKSAQEVQLGKTIVYKPGGAAPIQAACDAAGVKCADGVVVAGSPVGEPAFCDEHVQKFFDGVRQSTLNEVLELYRITAGVSEQRRGGVQSAARKVSRQDVYRIVRSCISPAAVSFLMRTTPTKYTLPHVDGLEAAVYELVHTVIEADAPRADGSDAETHAVAKLIAKLPARRGGLGLGDLVATATAAYVGSVALTGHVVKRFLDDEANTAQYDGATDGARLFPECAAAFADKKLARISAYEDVTIANFLETPVSRVQNKLSGFATEVTQAAVLARIARPDDKAFFLSGGEEGAYWLMCTGSFKTRALTDVEFATLVKARLGHRIVKGCDAPTNCPRCHWKAGTEPQLMGPSGTHALICNERGQGGAQGQRNVRHSILKNGLRDAMIDTSRPGAVVNAREPVVTDYFPAKAGAVITERLDRADIQAVYLGKTVLIDTVVTHPVTRSNKNRAVTPGVAAAASNKSKELQYSKLFDIPVGSLVPFAVETGGRWHPAARDFVKRWVKFGMSEGDHAEPDLKDPVILAAYAARIARFRATVSLALATAVASSLRYGIDHLSKGPVDPADAADGGESDSDPDAAGAED